MKIAYEPHPVSAERKAELRAQGFKVLDARFAPADESEEADAPGLIMGHRAHELVSPRIALTPYIEVAPQPVKRRGRKPRVQG